MHTEYSFYDTGLFNWFTNRKNDFTTFYNMLQKAIFYTTLNYINFRKTHFKTGPQNAVYFSKKKFSSLIFMMFLNQTIITFITPKSLYVSSSIFIYLHPPTHTHIQNCIRNFFHICFTLETSLGFKKLLPSNMRCCCLRKVQNLLEHMEQVWLMNPDRWSKRLILWWY